MSSFVTNIIWYIGRYLNINTGKGIKQMKKIIISGLIVVGLIGGGIAIYSNQKIKEEETAKMLEEYKQKADKANKDLEELKKDVEAMKEETKQEGEEESKEDVKEETKQEVKNKDKVETKMIKVPNLEGDYLKYVEGLNIQEDSSMSVLTPEYEARGIVKSQSIKAGKMVPVGTTIKVGVYGFDGHYNPLKEAHECIIQNGKCVGNIYEE